MTLDSCLPDSCNLTLVSPRAGAQKQKTRLEDVSDWESLFDFWEQNKKGGKYKNAESRNRMLEKLRELTLGDFEFARQAIIFCIDSKYQGFTDGHQLFYRAPPPQALQTPPAGDFDEEENNRYWNNFLKEARERRKQNEHAV